MSRVQRPTILALHGFTGSGEDFRSLQETESGSWYNWICPDLMGHGASPSPESLESYRLDAAIDQIGQARQLAPDPDRVILLAYSMGGRIALHYLMKAAPMPAYLIGASPGLETVAEREARVLQDQKWIELLAGPDPMETFCERWGQQPVIEPQTHLPEPLRSQLAERRRRNNPTGLSNSLLACGTGALPSLWEQLPALPPIHLLYGEQDTKFASIARRMASLNPAYKPVAIPGCGHAAHLENPEGVMEVVGESRVGPSRGR